MFTSERGFIMGFGGVRESALVGVYRSGMYTVSARTFIINGAGSFLCINFPHYFFNYPSASVYNCESIKNLGSFHILATSPQ